ncbi:MAG: RluA family pseudouridine synthase [Leptolyngbyaceae cyanobacterium SM1_1_3]|nr:RluA family pseudouridine synthase [Leptolyngbyaceae cyanobacterium SM1_1_3]NJN03199.1 RluA family pseudouridine synthase [Leptolyngbyaceae cyanobacterium RM1_1_2]NJO08882.1 RluA family pseudouridine synthase [Leptolyngbyaceae cyanobacterium SL_1_1]
MFEPIFEPISGQTFELTVAAAQPERLDRWLSDQLSQLSRSRIQKLIDQNCVVVNGQPCTTKKVTVQTGDRVQVKLPEAQPLDLQPEAIALDILYEDEALLILNKPADMVVHPAPGHTSGTLVNAILAYCGDTLAGIGGVQRPGIVHRLDKDTTGAIMIAKTDLAHQRLQAQLKDKTAGRDYLAIVYGAPKTDQGRLDLPLGRHPIDRKKQAIIPEDEGGRAAVTHWQLLERIGNHSLLQFRLETGRTHQIRVHSAHMGHPIVGDPLYGAGRSVGVNLPGQALHAWKLRLKHPISGELLEAIAPLPPTFTKLLAVLRRRSLG